MLRQFEAHILALIDKMVETATDDELFASGYLSGHLTLAVAQLEQQASSVSPDDLHDCVTQSIEKAIQAGELSPPDQRLVRNMWETLYQQAKKHSLMTI